MEKERTNQGVTLIALVITIIVLLILAGVSIAILTGKSGILDKANNAKMETNRAKAKEQIQMEVFGSYDDNGKLEMEQLEENLKKNLGLEEKEITKNEDGGVTVIVEEYEITVSKNGEVTVGDEIKEEKDEATNKPTSSEEEYESFKKIIAQAITKAGIQTENTETAEKMASNIEQLVTEASKNESETVNNLLNSNEIVYSNTYTVSGLTVGKKYLIFQTMIDDNARCGISSGATILSQSNILTTGNWRGTYAHGKVMLVKATNSTIVIGNSGSNYTTLSKAIVIPVSD